MSFYHQLQLDTERERAEMLAAPIIAAALDGNVTRLQYLRFLRRAYHHVRHTPALLMACGARLSLQRPWLQRAVSRYVEEELGHDEWILNDIAAAGGDPHAVRESKPDFHTDVMVAYAYDTIARGNPIGFFGMVYVLEGTSVALASQVADRLQTALDLPAAAFTYLRSHGALDIDHIEHFAALINRLDHADEREIVARSARAFYRLYGNVLASVDHEGEA